MLTSSQLLDKNDCPNNNYVACCAKGDDVLHHIKCWFTSYRAANIRFCRPIGELHGASPISKESISQSVLKLFQQRIHFNHLCFPVPFKIFPTPFLFVLMDILANFYIKINSRSIQKVRFHKLFPIFRVSNDP